MKEPTWTFLHPSHAQLVNTNSIVHKGPCILTGFSVAGKGAAAEADLYDGENALGEHKCKVVCIAGTTFPWDLAHPVDLDKGIYIEVNAETTFVTVCYRPESWKAFI